ncbi:MAG: ribonuclease D [Woeseiaceae bacterium]|nr:ribonuclease D [Woeseiaceae bacterium]
MPHFLYVEHPDTLTTRLADHDTVAVDTEFMREKTYFAQLCLVQIATHDEIFCVDPLTDNEQAAFWAALFARQWVVHSARQDIEVVSQTAGAMPDALFDTQIAAGLLGHPPQMGYADLVRELFDVDMAKSHTRADWTKRPLKEAFLDYAAEDVEHLLPAYEQLGEKLERAGRLAWAQEDSALLLETKLYDTGAEQAVDRLKGARNFRGPRRSAAAKLAVWRENEAIRRNRPRQWILRDSVLLDIAYRRPATEAELADIEGMSPKLLARQGTTLLRLIAESATDDNGYTPPGAPDEQQKALLKTLQARVKRCADELGIAAETLASRRELATMILSGRRDSRVFSGWRRDLIGKDLLALM